MRNIILLSALLISAGNIQAQNKSDKKTTITIINEENGKKTVIDTTFINADKETIDAFLQAQGMKKPGPPPPPSGKHRVPPVPPAPPVAPVPPVHGVAPVPPVPPAAPDDESSFYFHFDMPDLDADIHMDIERELEKAQEYLEKAREAMDEHFNKEKLEEIREDLKDQLKDLEKEIEKAGKHKRVIIRSKTGNIDTDLDNTTGYIYNYSTPGSTLVPLNYSYSYSMPALNSLYAGSGDEPIVIGNADMYNGALGSYSYNFPSCAEVKHKSKFRKLVNKVWNWILE
jgi:hypothetical protein